MKVRRLNILNRRLTTIISLLLCFFVLAQIGNTVYYSHSHLVEHGRVITHAHPYNKTSDPAPYKAHKHSSEQFFLFGQPEVLFLFLIFNISCIIAVFYYSYFEKNIHYSSIVTIHSPGRSPPHF